MTRPFDTAKYEAALKGLDITELSFTSVCSASDKFRIDNLFFSKTLRQTHELVLHSKHRPLVDYANFMRKGIFDIKADSYVDDGVPFARISDLKKGLVTSNTGTSISREAHLANLDTALTKGDLLISKTAYPAAGIVRTENCNASQDTIAVKVKESNRIYAPILWTYLDGRIGRLIMQRYFQGNVQMHLSLSDAKIVPVPTFSPLFAETVASLLQAAEILLEKSDAFHNSACTAFEQFVGLTDWEPTKRLNYVRSFSDVFDAERLDAEHFQEAYSDVRLALKHCGATHFEELGSMLVSITNGQTPLRHDLTEGEIPFLCAEHISDFVVKLESEKRVTEEQHQGLLSKTMLREGDILLTIKGRVGNFGLIPNLSHPANINQDVALLRLNGSIDAWYLMAIMNSRFGKLFVQQYSTGQINPFLGLGNAVRVPVARFSEKTEAEIAAKVKLTVTSAQVNNEKALKFLNVAKISVEIAIEDSEAAALRYIAEATNE